MKHSFITTILKTLRESLRRNRLIRWLYFDMHLADVPVILGAKNFTRRMNKAIEAFLSPKELQSDATLHRIRKDIKLCFYKYKATPEEYFLFGFKDKTPQERKTYLTDHFIMKSVANKTGRRIHDKELNNKYSFYLLNKQFFHRKAMLVDAQTTLEEFTHFSIQAKRIIAKPNMAALGSGISIFCVNSKDEARMVFDEIHKRGSEWIVEEVIIQSEEMARWNPTSVNTVRIPSFLHHNKFSILGPFIRTGRKGSVVDNAGHGGIFASIDISTGQICTNGVDELVNEYVSHPDSNIVFNGWKIPHWDDLIKLVEQIHRNNMSKHVYIGWDFALTDYGWVLIEGNWGQFVCQIPSKRGLKEDFLKNLNQ